MLYIAICEDENHYKNKVVSLVEAYLDKYIIKYRIDKFSSGTELINYGDIKNYHIIFLDIKMGEMDGLETAEKVRIYNANVFIVFITAFLKYSPMGYKVDAFRYILKDNMESSIIECMDCILDKMKMETEKMTFLFNDEGNTEIFISEILYIESYGHLLNFNMIGSEQEKHYMYEKLDNIEKKLTGYGFLRIRKSQLVNMKYIDGIRSCQVILKTGEILLIPEKRYRGVREKYNFYRGCSR